MTPTFKGELMLAGWSETHNGGAKVTFWLPDPADLEAFKPLTIAKGKTAGHRFMAVLVEIGDDEQPKEPAPKGGDLSKLAGRMCADPEFQAWLAHTALGYPKSINVSADLAAAMIRDLCGVKSRAELDSNADAAGRFHRLIRRPWAEHNAR